MGIMNAFKVENYTIADNDNYLLKLSFLRNFDTNRSQQFTTVPY